MTLEEMANLEIQCALVCKSCYWSLGNLTMGMLYISNFLILR